MYGRASELARLEELIATARAGRSGVLVLRGDPGIGKSALLDHAAASAGDLRVLRTSGIESESELPYAGLHLLLRPALDRLDALAEPQRNALAAAFGLGPAQGGGDRFLVGLAVLSLLPELSEDGGVVCLVDDAQWLDQASTEALLFAARRLDAEGVALVIAARDGAATFAAPGLPELALAGLSPEAADALLDAQFDAHFDTPRRDARVGAAGGQGLAPSVRSRVLREAAGNPLALAELPAALAREPAAAATPAGTLPLTDRLQVAFHGQVRRLPAGTQALLLLVAAADGADLDVVLRAASQLGTGLDDAGEAESAGLIRIDERAVRFRHPLVRAAVYQSAPLSERLGAHKALADAFVEPADRDRRAWHLAMASTGHDEQVAAELEASAARAAERGGHADAATAFERAARLSPDASARACRLRQAAEAAYQTGDFPRAITLAERAGAGAGSADRSLDHEAAAWLVLIRANAHFWTGALRQAHQVLLEGAEAVHRHDPGEAAWMLMQAVHVAWFTGDPTLSETAAARLDAVRLPADHLLRPLLPLMTMHARLANDREAGPSPEMTEAALRAGQADPRAAVMLGGAAWIAGRDDLAHDIFAGFVDEARAQGRIGWLAAGLGSLGEAQLFLGRHRDAATNLEEALRVGADTGQAHVVSHFRGVLAYLAALDGDEARCRDLTNAVLVESVGGGSSPGPSWAHWALSASDLAAGRTEEALTRLEALSRGPARHQIPAIRGTVDQVEAAVRLGQPERAAEPLARLEEWASWARQGWIDAAVCRCHALLAPDAEAEGHFVRAVELHELHDTAGHPFDEARTRLLYGEWLRRARRRVDARAQLGTALETFERLNAEPWEQRARAELRATGASVPTATSGASSGASSGVPDVLAGLTPQELQIVRMAAEGLSNRDIGTRLFLSPRTVGYHLYKAYPKLGISSRTQLAALVLGESAS
nr:helix-turn-helix transcriptional regulator [Actinopolymorpha pittospori]